MSRQQTLPSKTWSCDTLASAVGQTESQLLQTVKEEMSDSRYKLAGSMFAGCMFWLGARGALLIAAMPWGIEHNVAK